MPLAHYQFIFFKNLNKQVMQFMLTEIPYPANVITEGTEIPSLNNFKIRLYTI